MPIANCVVTNACLDHSDDTSDLIELWAKESNESAEHMTINIIRSHEQLGKRYGVMATLHVPTLWSGTDISSLQTGLARALGQHYKLPPAEIHVTTMLVQSGMVVENGEEIHWST